MESRARRAPGGLHAAGAMSAGNPPQGTPARRAPPFQTRRKGSTKEEVRRTKERGERGAATHVPPVPHVLALRGEGVDSNTKKTKAQRTQRSPTLRVLAIPVPARCGIEMLLCVVEVLSESSALGERGGAAGACRCFFDNSEGWQRGFATASPMLRSPQPRPFLPLREKRESEDGIMGLWE